MSGCHVLFSPGGILAVVVDCQHQHGNGHVHCRLVRHMLQVLGATYPWIARRLLTDTSPELQVRVQHET